jgi:hypothetical protein
MIYLFEKEAIYPQQNFCPKNRYHPTKKIIMKTVKIIIVLQNNH